MRPVTALVVLCYFVACIYSLTLDEVNVTKIKAGRDEVPAEEILALVKSLTETHLQKSEHFVSKKDVSSLIGQLGFDPSTIGKTYIYNTTTAVEWFTALAKCGRAGYELATITSAAEQLAVIQWLYANDHSSNYWIAGTDAVYGVTNYIWLNGFCKNYTDMDFTYWQYYPTAPDTVPYCTVVDGAHWGYWIEEQCTTPQLYICQSYN